ncbi:MAG TPA: alanine racemase [Clostridia bacterium]|nr:alanine racemase [Clostridia bacterium]
MYRKTYLEVDCDKLKNNIKDIKSNYNNYQYYIGVVKANAYGHGNFVIESLIEGGINYLAVSSLEEAINLRKYNIEVPILVLEPVDVEYLEVCVKNNITVTISSLNYFKLACKKNFKRKLKYHIKIDSGMSRLGIRDREELNELFNLQQSEHASNNFFLEGIYTHFATSGVFDKYWEEQLFNFKEITKDIDLGKIPIIHMGRSQTLVNHEKISFCNGIRLGIIMYGIDLKMNLNYKGIKGVFRKFKNDYYIKKNNISLTTKTNNMNISPVIKLCSEVIEIRKIKPNNFVSYGALFIAKENVYIATIPIGYADGVPKSLKKVEIEGNLFDIVGEVCMDMLMVKVDNSVKIYDKVVLIGGDLLSIKSITRQTGLSSYSIFTGITTRVPRIYKKNNNRTEISYFS